MTSPESEITELIRRARFLALNNTCLVGVYEHPRFFISISDDRLYVGLNDKAGQGQPVSVYWESRVNYKAPVTEAHVTEEWVPETLAWMRKVMLLDDIAGV